MLTALACGAILPGQLVVQMLMGNLRISAGYPSLTKTFPLCVNK
jgi:hypothetical protein